MERMHLKLQDAHRLQGVAPQPPAKLGDSYHKPDVSPLHQKCKNQERRTTIMTQSKKDLIKMIVWVTICMLAVIAIATYSHCSHSEEKEKQQNEATLVTPEDSVNSYEYGK